MTVTAPGAPRALLPGVLLGAAVGLAGWLAGRGLGGQVAWAPDAVVLALLFGLGLRAVWEVPGVFEPGTTFLARPVLEVAIVLLGVGTDLRRFAAAGLPLAAAVVTTTIVALAGGLVIGRRLGLAPRPALLVASGNAICGNSAIVAVGRVAGATAMETAAAIASTALLSVLLVLALPIVGAALGLPDTAYGALVGMTVYAMPQVLAATFPVSAAAGEIGTMVKLIRVMLMLPWLVWLGRRAGGHADTRDAWRRVLPWYLVLFLVAAAARTAGLFGPTGVTVAQTLAHALTVGAMAAVGLGVDPAAMRYAGPRASAAAALSMLLLLLLALGAVALLPR